MLCTFKAVLEVDGHVQAVRGILDSGSTLSFLTYIVANSLKAKKIPNVVDVSVSTTRNLLLASTARRLS